MVSFMVRVFTEAMVMKHKPLEVGGEFAQRSIIRNAQLYARSVNGIVTLRAANGSTLNRNTKLRRM